MSVRLRWPAVGAAAVVCLLVSAGVALGSGFTTPLLKAPRKGQAVHAGTITLVVYDPGVPKDVNDLAAQIEPRRKLDRNGFLARCLNVTRGCDFVGLRPWKGHPGFWRYTTFATFPGYWAVTPGKYYWQASHTAPLCQAKGCTIASAIHSFRVLG